MNSTIVSPKTKTKLPLKIKVTSKGNSSLRKGLLICGIISSLLYVAMNIIAAMLYEGYSSVSQTVSELSAIDAPTRPLWVSLAIVYSLLVIAFASGVLQSAGEKRSLSSEDVFVVVVVIVNARSRGVIDVR